MTPLWIGLALDCAITGLLLADDIRLRRRIHQQKVENAERAARALGDGLVSVDGVTLPSPDDERWKMGKVVFTVGVKDHTEVSLIFGGIIIDNNDLVFVGGGSPMSSTSETRNYVKQVRLAYRSRVARKAVSKS